MVPPRNSTVNASQDVSLACRAEAYPTNLTYSWFQDSTNVFHIRWGSGVGEGLVGSLWGASLEPGPHVPSCRRLQPRVRILVDGSLRLQAAQPDDAGRYTCVASNGLLRPPSASAYLTVLCKPDPALFPVCSPPLGQAELLPSNLPLLPSTRPSPGDSDASGDTPPRGHAGGDPVPGPG